MATRPLHDSGIVHRPFDGLLNDGIVQMVSVLFIGSVIDPPYGTKRLILCGYTDLELGHITGPGRPYSTT